MTAVGAASGTRAYLATRRFAWLTRKRLRVITIALAVAALGVSAVGLSGSSSTAHTASGDAPAQR